MSQHNVSIWGVFADQTRAGQALALLESTGFRQSEIAIEKRFKDALAGWSQALYVRVPEGIVDGFIGGAILAGVTCVAVARGVPPIFPLALVTCLGSVGGAILGAFSGMIVARYEARAGGSLNDDRITIGVLCSDPQAEDRAKVAFSRAGAAEIDTQN